MKNIGILTWMYNYNYGSILQAYALQKFLKDSKYYNIKEINFKSNICYKIKNFITNFNSIQTFKEKFELNKAHWHWKSKNNLAIKISKFDSFRNENFNLTKEYHNAKEIKAENNKYDIYICGSDQIWNPNLLNPIFYFSFLNNEKKVLSYATSFGVNNIPNKKKKKIKKLLKRFDGISIREKTGTIIAEKLLEKKVKEVLDPTLLLTCKDWNSIATRRIIHGDYILCYFLTLNKNLFKSFLKFSERIAKNKKYKIIIIPISYQSCKTEYETLYDVGPQEWISLIKNAKIICTDSFHGIIFSIIYQKEFFAFNKHLSKNNNSQNSRIIDLLIKLDLMQRLVDDCNLYSFNMKSINYNIVNSKLDILKNESIQWLYNSIEGKEHE